MSNLRAGRHTGSTTTPCSPLNLSSWTAGARNALSQPRKRSGRRWQHGRVANAHHVGSSQQGARQCGEKQIGRSGTCIKYHFLSISLRHGNRSLAASDARTCAPCTCTLALRWLPHSRGHHTLPGTMDSRVALAGLAAAAGLGVGIVVGNLLSRGASTGTGCATAHSAPTPSEAPAAGTDAGARRHATRVEAAVERLEALVEKRDRADEVRHARARHVVTLHMRCGSGVKW